VSKALPLGFAVVAIHAGIVSAHGVVPGSLKGVRAPTVPGLLSGESPIVRNRTHAIALGKALFWDVQVGSDGVACATCHYHAGVDARATNQLSPGRSPATRPTAATFQPMKSHAAGGPNYTLHRSDFPFHDLADVLDPRSEVLFTTDDVVGSAGSFGGTFRGSADAGSASDDCVRTADSTFSAKGLGTRHVTSRNTPTVINAVFNRRNFWDGRANQVFNGVNSLGDRDPDAMVWVWRRGRARRVRSNLMHASLASQAVEPPLDTSEMSCGGRTFPDIGRKLLRRHPLQFQTVHAEDSVLGPYRHGSGRGLRPTYAKLVRQAFHRRYWSAPRGRARAKFGAPVTGGPPYTQMEANFAFFFGLAVQLYESTLVSDEAPFDSERDADGMPRALDEQQQRGLAAFIDLHCNECHAGPTLSGTILPEEEATATEVDRKPIRSTSGGMALGLVDRGFVNTGVVPHDHDPGLAASDVFGLPLSLADQYLKLLQGRHEEVFDPLIARSCAMTAPFAVAAFGQLPFAPPELAADPAGAKGCSSPQWAAVPTPAVVARELSEPDRGRLADGTAGAFKVPSLRNVELTGPYMHNGGLVSLEEVLQFYNRGGNFSSAGKDAQFLFGVRAPEETLADVVAFLRSLTDERVRWERAPFDHPSLPVPHGHRGGETDVLGADLAATAFLDIPAVGAAGRPAALGPLLPFAESLAP
jgi:cytochrome c peroxidase